MTQTIQCIASKTWVMNPRWLILFGLIIIPCFKRKQNNPQPIIDRTTKTCQRVTTQNHTDTSYFPKPAAAPPRAYRYVFFSFLETKTSLHSLHILFVEPSSSSSFLFSIWSDSKARIKPYTKRLYIHTHTHQDEIERETHTNEPDSSIPSFPDEEPLP